MPPQLRPEVTEVADDESLADVPCRYPDSRPPARRLPFLYHAGRVYPVSEADGPVEGPGGLPVWLQDGRWRPLADAVRRLDLTPLDRRVAVLAVGSNASPRQLADKFARDPVPDDSVPVLAATVHDARIAFCPVLSRNGYVPVTVVHAPGAITHTWVQWLTAPQLDAISRSEGSRYTLVECGRLAHGAAAVEIHGAGTPPIPVYAWCFDAVLRFPGPATTWFAGSPPVGHPGDAAGVSEERLLAEIVAELVRRSGRALTWDGCTLPEGERTAARELLAEYAAPNPVPAHWTAVGRAPGFAEALIAGRG